MKQLSVKHEFNKETHELMRRDIIVGNSDHNYVLSYSKYYKDQINKQFYKIKIRKLKADIKKGDILRVQHMCQRKEISQIEGIISSITDKTLTEDDVEILKHISAIGIVGENIEEKQRKCLVLVKKDKDGNIVAENVYNGFENVELFAIDFDCRFMNAYMAYKRKKHIDESTEEGKEDAETEER